MPQIPKGTFFSLYIYGVANQIKVSEGCTFKINRSILMELGLQAFKSTAVFSNSEPKMNLPCLVSWLNLFLSWQTSRTCIFKNLPWYTELSLYFILDQVLLPYPCSINTRTLNYSWWEHIRSEPLYQIKITSWSKRLPGTFFYFSDSTF